MSALLHVICLLPLAVLSCAAHAVQASDEAVLPPLEPARLLALETAIDDQDHQESAFQALMEGMLALDPARVDAASLNRLDTTLVGECTARPEGRRGHPFLIAGRLEQSNRLAPPFDSIVEWFVRLPGGDAVAVYLPAEEDAGAGDRVRLVGRFYKRLSGVSRAGTPSKWAAFGGRRLPQAAVFNARAFLVLMIVVLVVAWWLLRRLVARSAPPDRLPSGRTDGGQATADEDLPRDPVAALDELARRSDDPGRKARP